jgi:anti-sigma-K factor RskA
LAGEYVLGVLSAEERARAEAKATREEDFAALVAFWEARFAPLALELPVKAPRAAVKRRIMTTLFADEAQKQKSALASALSFWRTAAAAMAAVALVTSAALVYFTVVPQERVVQTQLVATVLPAGQSPILEAALDERLNVLRIENATIELGDDQVAELWLIPEDGTPRSLGLINASGGDSVEIPRRLRVLFAAGAALAVSLEPPGGSPTGAPTGPIVGLGQLGRK